MSRAFLFLLLAAALLSATPGCGITDSVSVKAGDIRIDGADATVAPGFSVPDTEDLWGPTDGPLLRTRLGPAMVAHTREGDMFVVFPNGRRAGILVPAEGTPGHDPRRPEAPFARRPADPKDQDWITSLGNLLGFISAPYAALPSALEGWLRGPDEELCSAAADLTQHLLDADRATFHGTIGRKGTINGWLAPTPAAREKLVEALRAAEHLKR